jgi:hypothetical protein
MELNIHNEPGWGKTPLIKAPWNSEKSFPSIWLHNENGPGGVNHEHLTLQMDFAGNVKLVYVYQELPERVLQIDESTIFPWGSKVLMLSEVHTMRSGKDFDTFGVDNPNQKLKDSIEEYTYCEPDDSIIQDLIHLVKSGFYERE